MPFFHEQSTLRGRITGSSLSIEANTASFTAEITDANTGESRVLDATQEVVLTFDPQNLKAQGIEKMRPGSLSEAGGTTTFLLTKRGLSLDVYDEIGAVANAKEWVVGTEFGITTGHINTDYQKKRIDGTESWENAMSFLGQLLTKAGLRIGQSPALLTSGASATTSLVTWGAVSDGEFAVTLDGVAIEVTGIDFTNIGDLDGVADRIEVALRAVTSSVERVRVSGSTFTIQSADSTSTSAITVLSTIAAPSGTDISGAGGTNFLDMDTGNGTITAAADTPIVGDGNLTFQDSFNSAITLSTIAAAAGADEKAKVSINDTTSDFLINKFTAGTNVTIVETNDGGNESLTINALSTNPSTSLTTGENVDAGNALRIKSDGFVHKALSLQISEFEITASSNLSTKVSVCQIDTDKIVHIYQKTTDFDVYGIVKTWDGEVWTDSAEQVIIASGNVGGLRAVKIDDNKFVLAYNEATTGKVVVSTVSGTTISSGTPVNFQTSYQTSRLHDIVSSATDAFSLCYMDDATSDRADAVSATVSGTTISLGTPVQLNSTTFSGNNTTIVKLDTNKVACLYKVSGTVVLRMRIATISGNTMSFGSEVTTGASHASIAVSGSSQIDTDVFLMTASDTGGITLYTCTVSGTTPTIGTGQVISTAAGLAAATFLSANRIFFSYTGIDAAVLENKFLSASGTVSTLEEIGPTATPFTVASNTSLDTALVNDSIANLVVYNTTDTEIESNNTAYNLFIGFADTTVTSGNPVSTNIVLDDNQSGLSVGTQYFLGDAGSVRIDGSVKAGIALSATEILKN